MITKENITEVLKHNGIDFKFYDLDLYLQHHTNMKKWYGTYDLRVGLDNPNLIPIIEAHIGMTLEPLPEPNPFDVVKVGQWIKMKAGSLAGRTTKDKWYQRVERNNGLVGFKYTDDDNDACTSNHPEQWDLTDIRDYNPDEEILLKVGDNLRYLETDHIIKRFNYAYQIVEFTKGHSAPFSSFDKENNCCEGNATLNGKQGKFVIPPFDFEKTLLDAGFTRHFDGDPQLTDDKYYKNNQFIYVNYAADLDKYYYDGEEINPTPANAERLIKAAAILNELDISK